MNDFYKNYLFNQQFTQQTMKYTLGKTTIYSCASFECLKKHFRKRDANKCSIKYKTKEIRQNRIIVQNIHLSFQQTMNAENNLKKIFNNVNVNNYTEASHVNILRCLMSNQRQYIDLNDPYNQYVNEMNNIQLVNIQNKISMTLFEKDFTIKPNIYQGHFGDCILASILTSIALFKPEIIRKMFLFEINPARYYCLRFCIYGDQQIFEINSDILIKNSDFYTSACLTNCLWYLLIQKALAKFYGEIPITDPTEIFYILSGLDFATYDVQYGLTQQIINFVSLNYPMIAYSLEKPQQKSITKFHSFSILNCEQSYINLKNPWFHTGFISKSNQLQFLPKKEYQQNGFLVLSNKDFVDNFETIFVLLAQNVKRFEITSKRAFAIVKKKNVFHITAGPIYQKQRHRKMARSNANLTINVYDQIIQINSSYVQLDSGVYKMQFNRSCKYILVTEYEDIQLIFM